MERVGARVAPPAGRYTHEAQRLEADLYNLYGTDTENT